MACHIMDMPYWALDLGSPRTVSAEFDGLTPDTGPDWSTITYEFAARAEVGGGDTGGAVGPRAAVEQPALRYVWYDGKRDGRQNAPHDLLERLAQAAIADGRPIKNPTRGDVLLVGDEGMMLFQRGSTNWVVTPANRLEEFAEVPGTIRRVPNEDVEWVEACHGGPKPLSSFDYAGPLTEMVLLGNLAVRLGKTIEWDADNLKATNAPEADPLIHRSYRRGWEPPLPADLLKVG
jgi:hypothetical protein